ncbi:carboxymuconolactone decarboxylase family protein [Variovorax sp. Sphag1AA]|uniref:carboxymuconolactone decarboxylase family protein n=1 Tax=Variovorax sp. Sphag1AA TaxID=2587027 RepID=UPI00161FB655|nr:carboxymuconolactone decarboxylase family protein [Variovorax sp. Sphag1AA]MBB3181113.1 alkylhydroperoxidase/carboxymuconolactone decarboxylase family protein YurZ [Variovorax sp. Sphag1AA]
MKNIIPTFLLAAACTLVPIAHGLAQTSTSVQERSSVTQHSLLPASRQAIIPIAAFAAVGDLGKLNSALNQGLDAGLTVSECREVLVQLYAYSGFPRSLNALSELMKVLRDREQRGIKDPAGRAPTALPPGSNILELGTANQTKLAGAPVRGPLFKFAPAIDEYLKTHLFGDIFARDNLDWQSRELATVGALAAMTGVEPQLLAHIRISLNVGLTEAQLRQVGGILAEKVGHDASARVQEALQKKP